MYTESCPHCGNIVSGVFSPSNTRKFLTSLAKKGGMKAVMTYVGTVFPGIGNITGFLVGAGIDFIYGDNISKFIDKIADEIDENKMYLFSCPQCGHEWSRKEEDLDGNFEDNLSDSEIHNESTSSLRSSRTKVFNTKFEDFLNRVDAAVEDTKATDALSLEMELIGNQIGNSDPDIASQYLFLAGLCDLLFAKKRYPDTNSRRQLKRARAHLKHALKYLKDDEYNLMLSAAETLLCTTAQQCIKEGTIDTEHYAFQNQTLFKEDWLIEIYESCRFWSILNADGIIQTAEDGKYDNKMRADLWRTGLNFRNQDYRMVCNLNFVFYGTDRKDGENVSTEEAKALDVVVNTPGYKTEDCDVNNFFHQNWLAGCVFFAKSIIEGVNPYTNKHPKEQFKILEKISKLGGDSFAVCLAGKSLGEYYEKGIGVEKDITKAMAYYKKVGSEEDIVRLMTESASSCKTSFLDASSSISDIEAEYLEEVKACLEDGEIAKSERRLLDKLRVKLGISESRATEIEASLLKPQLTGEEQEYLNEYRECLQEGGVITPGERRLLNKLRITLGISESRAAELEMSN